MIDTMTIVQELVIEECYSCSCHADALVELLEARCAEGE